MTRFIDGVPKSGTMVVADVSDEWGHSIYADVAGNNGMGIGRRVGGMRGGEVELVLATRSDWLRIRLNSGVIGWIHSCNVDQTD